MIKEVMMEHQEPFSPSAEMAYLRGEVTRLRDGNAVILKENARMRPVFEAAMNWSGEEPSSSVLVRAVDEAKKGKGKK